MEEWTVIMMLEGGGADANVTLAIGHVVAQSLEEAVLEAWEPFAKSYDDTPTCVGLIVQRGKNVDVAGQASSWLRTMLNF